MCVRPTPWTVDFTQRVVNAVFSGTSPDDEEGRGAEARAGTVVSHTPRGGDGGGGGGRERGGEVDGGGDIGRDVGGGGGVHVGARYHGHTARGGVASGGGGDAGGASGGILAYSYGFKRDQPAVWHVLSQTWAAENGVPYKAQGCEVWLRTP